MSESNLSAKEYNEVGLAVFETISKCPCIPKKIKFDYQALRDIGHIGFVTMAGGKIVQRYVTGGFMAHLPFQIIYKCAPTNNENRLKEEEILNSLADWMEEQKPLLSGGRKVEEIITDSITYPSKAEQDGSMVFVRSGVMKYEKD